MIKHILTLIWNKKRSNFLLFLEIFLAFIVLFAVLTFASYNLRNYSKPLGLNTENVWIAYLDFENVDSLAQIQMKEQLKRELKVYQEIETVAFTNNIIPFGGSNNAFGNRDNGFSLQSYYLYGDEDYQQAMDINLIAGRWFNEEDKQAKYQPVVITKFVKDEFFGGREIIDSVFIFNGEDSRIIGVMDHFRYQGEFSLEDRVSIFYGPTYHEEAKCLAIKVKDGIPLEFEEKVNKTIAQITKRNDFVIRDLDDKRKESSREVWVPLIALFLLCAFLILNIALGLFGVLWFNISKRRAEIGLRRTLGATQANISIQFILEIFSVSLMGILIGMFFALQLPLLKLVDIDNSNYYYAILVAILIITIVVLICTLYPSRQAATIHPALALHEE